HEVSTPLLVLPFPSSEGLSAELARLDDRLGGILTDVRQRGDFRGREDETLLLYPSSGAIGAERLLLVGYGNVARPDQERVRPVAGTAIKQAARLRAGSFAVLLPEGSGDAEARSAAEGAVLGAYTFAELKAAENGERPGEVAEATLLCSGPVEEAVRVGIVLAEAENLARRLGNLPPNVCTPRFLADTARQIATEQGLECTVLGREELRAEQMGALLAVAQGSEQEPQLIVLQHRGGAVGTAPLVLVGKAITFDAGGISIKPAASMEDMKFDMCGGAAVLGAMQAIGALKVPLNVIGVIPACENLLGGAAMRPGDILRSHLSKTIEVVNTDAEGRLILADALSYIRRFEPAACLDAATLTGACVIALGHQASGAMGNDLALLEDVPAAGDRAGQRVWPLPMYDEYREQLKSDYADIKNTGGRAAGAITAGWFLRDFVGDFPWVHLDIAGTAWGDGKLPYQTKGATGVPTRLFVEWVLARAA
ncbi:MAG: Cytosol aminopeptidase PepA, partial [uncultured Gemmatimonadetes bacterium]